MRQIATFVVSLLAGVSALALAGCAQFRDQPLSAESARADFDGRSLADAGLQSFLAKNLTAQSAASGAWDFERLALAAMYFNPDLEVARAELAGAIAAQRTAGALPNPTVGLNATYNFTTGIPSPWILGPTLELPVETAGKRGFRRAQAAHLAEAAQFKLASAAWQVRSRVRKEMLALYAAGENAALLRRQEAMQGEAAKLMEAQREAGGVSPFEVVQSRVALNQTRFALQDAEHAEISARIRLAEAIGIPTGALAGAKLRFDEFRNTPAKVPGEQVRRQALTNRSDILAALAEYAGTQSALRLEIAKQYPDLRLSPGFEYDQGDNKWGLGLALELPLLNRNQGPIAEAEGRRTAAAAKFDALQAKVIAEIELAIAACRAAAGKAETAGSLNRELTAQFKSAQGMLDAGEISRVELSQRQLELTNAESMQLNARIQAQEALGALEDALQSPASLAGVTQESPRQVWRPLIKAEN